MSNSIRIFVSIAMLGVMLGCTKKKIVIPIPSLPKEENIEFSIDPDRGTAVAVAMSGTYGFKVNITSKLPGSGVKLREDLLQI